MAVKLSKDAIQVMQETIPPYMHQGLVGYFEEGRPPGSFLHAVLANNLLEAHMQADATNKHHLGAYCYWLYNYAPSRASGAWGSYTEVSSWLRKAEAEREKVIDEQRVDY
jgi:hypothetical protein